MKQTAFALAIAVTALGAISAQASTITDGFTFSVATSGTGTGVGSHFHSSTGGDFGNPSGKAEVGAFSSEDVRGLSEYNLTGLATSATAFVTFGVYQLAGLFSGVNDFLYGGTITVDAYLGNNLENISDFQAASIGTIGTFSTSGLSVGDTLSFSIASIYNSAIGSSASSLGIRLSANSRDGGAVTFDNFRLTTDDQSTNNTNVVPLMGALPLTLSGLAALGLVRRRKRAAA
ncbi:VPLPA-CTERM sorting domain-containing protein [Rhodobacter maris]|uniref:Secreted protein n=1 Tax=Rhodobacter maris TaxID=446682 RepID=A0A285RVL0_9RHOB|nr:VPLPA-CTERM sorting domain-containing protein [Rhodobacter maris]SOB98580.1 hypothetical protein SAMN05877831_10218 [Rhodobacter maris]